MSLDPSTTLGRVSLTVSDLERSLLFYRDTLGFEVEESGSAVNLLAGGRELVSLVEEPGARPKPENTTGLYHYAILLPDRPSLGRLLGRLGERGYPLWGASDHFVSEALYLDDPDGNGVEIYRDRPREEWTFSPDGMVRMGTVRLNLREVLDASGAAPWDGMPAGTAIGHVHLHVGDLAEAERFYAGTLGFNVMARYADEALFVSAGGYHHHVGLNTWAGVGAPRPPEGSAGLRFFEVLLPNAAELDRVAGRLARSGVEGLGIEGGAARVRDPWGNAISFVNAKVLADR